MKLPVAYRQVFMRPFRGAPAQVSALIFRHSFRSHFPVVASLIFLSMIYDS